MRRILLETLGALLALIYFGTFMLVMLMLIGDL